MGMGSHTKVTYPIGNVIKVLNRRCLEVTFSVRTCQEIMFYAQKLREKLTIF